MGLDMYLKAEKYIGGWEHKGEAERTLFEKIIGLVGSPEMTTEGSPSLTVSITCAYWRKANAIHGWFVENVQGGEDECESFPVEREQLELLRDSCHCVLEKSPTDIGDVGLHTTYAPGKPPLKAWKEGEVVVDTKIAESVLPTRSGFFFGSTEYDEYYLQGLRDTVEQIDRVLKAFDDSWSFSYRSSW